MNLNRIVFFSARLYHFRVSGVPCIFTHAEGRVYPLDDYSAVVQCIHHTITDLYRGTGGHAVAKLCRRVLEISRWESCAFSQKQGLPRDVLVLLLGLDIKALRLFFEKLNAKPPEPVFVQLDMRRRASALRGPC
jgi:hypothetical protein